jgi:Phage Single-stranded DNA-binding protein
MAKETARPEPTANLQTATAVPIVKIKTYFGNQENADGYASNMQMAGLEGLQMLTKLHGKAELEVDDLQGKPFLMKWFYAHKVELRSDKGGEVVDAIRVVLVDPDRRTLGFVSDGVVDSLDLIRSILGDGPYDPPIPVRVVRQKTRGGNSVLRLIAD